jgi:hypothetical protein
VWGSALDVLLNDLRKAIHNSSEQFPHEALERQMRASGKSLVFTDEEIEELADMRYPSRNLFGLLTMLFPFVDTRNLFHIDHVFPTAVFHARKLKQLGLSPQQIEILQDHKDRLPNLQLLQGPDNQSKSSQLPASWIKETYKTDEDRKDYISRYLLDGVMVGLDEFEAFFEKRRKRLIARILIVLNGETKEG